MKAIKTIVLLLGMTSMTSCALFQRQSRNDAEISNMPFAKLYTSVWMQRAAEYKALCYQAFNVAETHLMKEVKDTKNKKRKLAIITDIDETFLDNSPNSVFQARKNELYQDEEWHRWCAMASADTIPGGLDFFKKAAAQGVEIFYISNRSEKDRKGTLTNLQKFGFPNADDAHLLLRTNTSNKDERRQKVLAKYHVIMYLGDNLGDFSSAFDKADEDGRNAALFGIKESIGTKFIVLPNPNYGTWESALMGHERLSPDKQAERYRQKAKAY
ncbi:Outer membrane protein P4 [Porphyromonas cangingivalis]|uniref:5'-nucleotidase n=1 Tax=Porphyromonas cangingivalis TaxID=36874 RepID=A0A0A2ERF7_PORCN|nr:5'-nucleotidase, lipoprotein e(P4) family [Porphyromonas cangingivalis]KGN80272.1 5'-nucleotidase [Porphyromonas cangingivalis]SPY36008.1 Outer membrane protein P4 [Porphyromonas cangingivalis]